MTEKLTEWRKQFEAELQLEAALHAPEVALSRHDDGTYRVPAVQSAWWGYQAGRRTTTDPIDGAFVSRADLDAIYAAMNHLGDVLNEMDAVEAEDEAATEPGFIAIRRALGEKQ